MVILASDFIEIMQTIGVVATFIIPVLLLVLYVLYKKGIITKGQKEMAEGIIEILTGSIDRFKTVDKPASKGLTTIIGKKVENAEVKEHLEGYLKKFYMNENRENG